MPHLCIRRIVGWSDLAFFRFSKTYTFLLSNYIFRNTIPKNRQFRPRKRTSHGRQSFHFKTITATLRIYIFLKIYENLPHASKNNRQKENLTNYVFFVLVFIFQKWSKLFLICTRSK